MNEPTETETEIQRQMAELKKASTMSSTREWQIYKELVLMFATRGMLDPTPQLGSVENVTKIAQHAAGLTQIIMQISREKKF